MASSLLLATIVVLGLAGAASAGAVWDPSCYCVGGYCDYYGNCHCYDGYYGQYCDINCDYDPYHPYCACRDCDFGNQNIQITAHGYYPHDFYCNKFWQCTRTHSHGYSSYTAELQCCPVGTKWSQKKLTCVHGDCYPRYYPCPTHNITKGCNFTGGHNLRIHPHKCHTFQQCVHHNSVDMCCPAGLVFNEEKKYCDHIQHPNPNCWDWDCKPPPTYCPGAIFCCWFSQSLQDQSINRAHVRNAGSSNVVSTEYGAYCSGNDFLIVEYFSNLWIHNHGPSKMLMIFVFKPLSGGSNIQGLFGNGGCGEVSTIGCKIVKWGQSTTLECWVNGVTVSSVNYVYLDYPNYAYLYYNNGELTLVLNGYTTTESGSNGVVQGNKSPFFICHNGCADSIYGDSFHGYIYKLYWYVDDDCDGHFP